MDYRTGEIYNLGGGIFQIRMIITINDKVYRFKLEVTEKALGLYEGVSNQHYTNGEDIVVISAFRPMVSDNGILYRRASQKDYDQWMKKKFPSSVNAAVYKTIVDGVKDII